MKLRSKRAAAFRADKELDEQKKLTTGNPLAEAATPAFTKLSKSMDEVRSAMWQLIRDAKTAKATGFTKQAIKVESEIAKLHHTLSSQS